VARNLLGEIDSLLAWRAGGRLLVGRERIALLEAVMEHESITKACSNSLNLSASFRSHDSI